MEVFGYRRLVAYQKAKEVVKMTYKLIKKCPSEERYGMSDQLRRASVSITSNIAEGRGRLYHKEFFQFLSISRGSLYEIETQLEICERLNYIDKTKTEKAKSLIVEISKMLNALAVSLETKQPLVIRSAPKN